MRVCILGDTHAGYDGAQGGVPSVEVHGPIVQKFMEMNPYMVFNLGDVIHNRASNPWGQFTSIASPLISQVNGRYYPVFGNHDVNGFFSYFNQLPTNGPVSGCYSVETADALFAVLKVYKASEAPPDCTDYTNQIHWLNTLLRDTKAPFKFVFWHRPAITTGARGPNLCAAVFFPTIWLNETDIVFCGHIHAYERFYADQVHYVVSGGAGGFPHDLGTASGLHQPVVQSESYNYIVLDINRTKTSLKATMRAYCLDDQLIDGITIDKSHLIPDPKPNKETSGKGGETKFKRE